MIETMTHLGHKIREPLKLFGWVDGGLYLAATVLANISRGRCGLLKYYFVAQPVAPEPLAVRGAADVVIRLVPQSDPLLSKFPRPPAVIRARYAQGACCFAACKNQEFIGYAWVVFGRYQEDEVRCLFLPSPPDKAAWDFDVYVEPKYRIGRAFLRLWDAVNCYLRERGYQWTLSRISAFNRHSLTSHGRLGSVRLGSAVFLRLGPAQLTFSSCKPRVHVSLSQRTYPTLRLTAPSQPVRT
jgi:hypothetical protein